MGIELYYTECGNGEPLVLLHGNGENCGYFKHQMEHFSREYHVIAIDTRGHGKSPRGTEPFTLKQFAKDLKAFLDEKKLGQVNLLGFSDGGNIALIFAIKYPSYVKRLILNGANLYPSGVKLRWRMEGYREYLRLLTSAREEKSRGEATKLELMRLMIKEPHIKTSVLFELKMPVLVIAGTNDMIRTSHTKRIAGATLRGKLALIEGDHFIAAKNPAVFNAAVENFLKSS
ncbi:MAG: alpha/beta hydrolase [Clostridiaceae bacterium]|nr:alpha/beta hydrolase [Clostridiaceae bacterium]